MFELFSIKEKEILEKLKKLILEGKIDFKELQARALIQNSIAQPIKK